MWGRGHCPPTGAPCMGLGQYIARKSHATGIKFYPLADNTGGYVVDVYLYTGRRGRVRRFGSCEGNFDARRIVGLWSRLIPPGTVFGLHGRNGAPVRRPIPTRDTFTDTWKELVTPLDLRPPVSVPDPPASGRSWPLPSWARYVQSRPSLVDTIDWTRPPTCIVRGDAYPCAGGSWTQVSIGLLNHGAQGRTPGYLRVIGMAVCGDKDMAALAAIWGDNLKVCGPFVVCQFLRKFLEINIYISVNINAD